MTPTPPLDELTGDYVIDTAHTRIGFVARHTVGGRVRGQFDEFEGGAHLDGGHPSKSGIRLTVRAHSIRTGDQRRDKLLRGRFLDVESHPVIAFSSVAIARDDGARFKVTGNLTIRGATQPLVLDVELHGHAPAPQGDPQGVPMADGMGDGLDDGRGAFRLGFKGGVTVNRGDWGVNWNAATTALISPKVALEFDIAVLRRP
ncbi:polyisoprenoid-binding protein [Streptomyces sp. WAC 01529]|uniref:YceI family protein n=1 Tax=Streptomyces sp. WAC 01529 TaxID=2203205 RepID=UPI000F6F2F8E|nr:YceI family protein [Streptomyces sp. WAC 01529]AZM54627.1 polyisoprenoid-binding protein [Streptomyces sp. WAC 01529]